MKQSYKKVITALNNLAKIWDKDLMLVSNGGDLEVVLLETKEVLASILGIPNDGGDAETYEIDGKEYLDLI